MYSPVLKSIACLSLACAIGRAQNTTAKSNTDDITEIYTPDGLRLVSNIIHIDVGIGNRLSFVPSEVTANVGDEVRFKFHSFNHSISQSTLDQPCEEQYAGFRTGFNQFNPDESNDITVSFTVNSLEPAYFFCHQEVPVTHCELGMVFVINGADTSNQFFENVNRSVISNSSASISTSWSTNTTFRPLMSPGNTSTAWNLSTTPTSRFPTITSVNFAASTSPSIFVNNSQAANSPTLSSTNGINSTTVTGSSIFPSTSIPDIVTCCSSEFLVTSSFTSFVFSTSTVTTTSSPSPLSFLGNISSSTTAPPATLTTLPLASTTFPVESSTLSTTSISTLPGLLSLFKSIAADSTLSTSYATSTSPVSTVNPAVKTTAPIIDDTANAVVPPLKADRNSSDGSTLTRSGKTVTSILLLAHVLLTHM